MGKKKQSALQTAMSGETEKLTDKEAKGALSQAIDKLTSITRRAETSKEAIVETGSSALHSAETLGSVFLSSMAEGFLGGQRLKLGGIDLRALGGVALEGYGLYQLLSGESGGQHALAIGNGVTASWLASAGVDAGRALKDRRAEAQLPTQSAASPTAFQGEPMVRVPALPVPTMQLIPDPSVRMAGGAREILLTPEGDEVAGPRHRVARRMSARGAEEEEMAGPGRRMIRQRMAQNRFPRASDADGGADGGVDEE